MMKSGFRHGHGMGYNSEDKQELSKELGIILGRGKVLRPCPHGCGATIYKDGNKHFEANGKNHSYSRCLELKGKKKTLKIDVRNKR